ncbi:FecR family protein [Olivibacter domesticus]|uniref:FecR family protein n=1 Tax=Olivibacter domesticus TaxID=407022 RepID=A0A1H7QQ66_OLID1|nr:FecR family protein [Olivibacter domesticus]SEL49868.1 FecR family protein [Olivibacter domesticus]
MELNNSEIAPLIGKYLQNTISVDEMRILKNWLEENEEHKRFLESFNDTDLVNDEITFLEHLDVEAAWQKIKKRKYRKAAVKIWMKLAVASAAIILLTLGFFLSEKSSEMREVNKQKISLEGKDILPGDQRAKIILSDGTMLDLGKPFKQIKEQDGTEIQDLRGTVNYAQNRNSIKRLIFNTLKVPKAGTYQLTLPDGTKVWVNAMSTLRFPVQFVGEERRVYLEGEAYFEVAKDYTKPFVVEIAGSQIEVLGTQFNVSTYHSDMTTTLVEGMVKVSNGEKFKLLKPGQEAKIHQKQIAVTSANLAKAIAWKEGDFYFEKDDIMDVMQQLQRWYDFKVEYKGTKPNQLFSGTISRNSRLSEVLDMLNFVSDNTTKFEVEDYQVKIIFNKQ